MRKFNNTEISLEMLILNPSILLNIENPTYNQHIIVYTTHTDYYMLNVKDIPEDIFNDIITTKQNYGNIYFNLLPDKLKIPYIIKNEKFYYIKYLNLESFIELYDKIDHINTCDMNHEQIIYIIQNKFEDLFSKIHCDENILNPKIMNNVDIESNLKFDIFKKYINKGSLYNNELQSIRNLIVENDTFYTLLSEDVKVLMCDVIYDSIYHDIVDKYEVNKYIRYIKRIMKKLFKK